MTRVMMESQMVIAMRLWGMAGGWPMTAAEQTRMVTEKVAAAQASGLAVARALVSGAGPGKVAMAALKPVRKRTSANVKRLSRAVTSAKS
ncbi:MAG: antibiotic ABC transporter [Cereibacter sphaeroides]|uniref:Antibiotic ABC transporter n=1 Tax=Cereibacter sphaeroides TaxID=1063 RepID=A0A2W5TV78_CERSP|nr:MAG: antibiotic ABC transporter [Cereibacter sphaeroides]